MAIARYEKITNSDIANKFGEVDTQLLLKEDTTHRVSSFQETPDHLHYPTERLVKESLDLKASKEDITYCTRQYFTSVPVTVNTSGERVFYTIPKSLNLEIGDIYYINGANNWELPGSYTQLAFSIYLNFESEPSTGTYLIEGIKGVGHISTLIIKDGSMVKFPNSAYSGTAVAQISNLTYTQIIYKDELYIRLYRLQ